MFKKGLLAFITNEYNYINYKTASEINILGITIFKTHNISLFCIDVF